MNRILLALGILLFTATVPASAAPKVTELNGIVAVVNNDVITNTELNQRVESVVRQLQQNKTPMPPEHVLRKQVLERLVLDRLQLQLAARRGVQISDEQVNHVLGRIAEENHLTLDQFRAELKKEGLDFARFRENIRNEMTISRLRTLDVENRVTVSPQEVDEFLRTLKASGSGNVAYHLRHILVAVPEAASPEQVQKAKAKALHLVQQLRSGADFAQLAVANSDGQQALKGGDLGWRKGAQLPTLFAELVAKMKPGGISDPVRSASGFHIIQLVEKKGEARQMVEQTHARHILIKTSELVSDFDARTKLERLRERILHGESFAELARADSEDPGSAIKGGDLGWSNPGDMVPQFEAQMNKLKPGQISEPFKTSFGWHIVEVLGRRQVDNSALQQRAKAQEALRQRKIDEALENWLRRLRDEAYVNYRLDQ